MKKLTKAEALRLLDQERNLVNGRIEKAENLGKEPSDFDKGQLFGLNQAKALILGLKEEK